MCCTYVILCGISPFLYIIIVHFGHLTAGTAAVYANCRHKAAIRRYVSKLTGKDCGGGGGGSEQPVHCSTMEC